MIKILKDILFSFYLLISSVVFSVIVTLNISPILYSLFIKLNKIPNYNNLSREEILNDYNNIIHYLNSPQEEVLKFKNFKISPIGEFHFLEVKEIFSSIYLICLACLILGLILFILLKKFKLKISLKAFNIFFYEVLFIFLGLILSFYLNFSKVFTLFHKIFFNNDYWIFDPKKDPIINVLPESYFLFLAVFILFLVMILSITSKIFYTLKKHKYLK
ncbi:TIGR01906 family membrane protein [Clostridium perfringens]|uniref:TIGR01906 family membrane protein n=1 Tax=Clostridium perfringens TaxID=1502 RepID=UPI0018E40DCB|nr:TIGR01906 family membrane protein [Clostridium perfringens]MBI5997289.1 TIGR01906 family membrane protein [Clostridium perfringens]MBI6038468.1 TIGR01906 family membrane protein [Clostridium perfringens]